MTRPKIKELAAKVKAYIEKHGHCQDTTYGTPGGPMCVLGAAGYLSNGVDYAYPHEFFCALGDVLGHHAIVMWNDTAPTADVLAVLQKVAES